MQSFHVIIRAIPNTELLTRTITLDGRDVDALIVPSDLQALPLGVTFEQAVEMLGAFPQMYIEPDGSFVWVSVAKSTESWQVDGNLYDRDGSLIAIDLKGTYYRSQLGKLFDVFRADKRKLMIEIVRDGVFLRERDFLELLRT
jgi:hypothetical protein